MLRYELVNMRKFNLLSIASDPLNDGSKNYGAINNSFGQLLPGMNVNYVLLDSTLNHLELYSGAYMGYTPPTSSVGFIGVDEEGSVNTSPEEENINMRPELSRSYEFGVRGYGAGGKLQGQMTVFDNTIENYYAAGRKEAFETLGSVNIRGLELNGSFDFGKLLNSNKHELILGFSCTWMQSKILSGLLKDSDLFKARHTDATKQELIDKINGERSGYSVYFANDSLIERTLTVSDFDNIESIEFGFGEGKIQNNAAPYVPNQIISVNMSYGFEGFNFGVSYSRVGAQYTEYLNFENETAEGAIGKLEAYGILDANIGYTFKSKSRIIDGMNLFVAGKNLLNEIYTASRLHRVSSGIMPGGFRQINAGIIFNL